MRKTLFVLIITICICFSFFCFGSSADTVVFTKQPQGGETLVGRQFTITFEVNTGERVMLQGRDDETYDWGNYDYITSPYVFPEFIQEHTEQYRLYVYNEADQTDYYSDIFTISWKFPENMTSIDEATYWFESIDVGYTNQEVLPVIIKNTGDYDIVDPVIEVSDESFLELIENSPIKRIKAGETDSTSYSVRPRLGLGPNTYSDSVFVRADSLKISNISYYIEVKSNGEELYYAMTVNNVDFGTLKENYETPDSQTLVIKATGSGNLTNIHLKRDGNDTFFRIKSTTPSVSYLNAGFYTTNWYVDLEPGLSPGTYSGTIEVYADEIEGPVTFTVKAVVKGEGSQDETVPGGNGDSGDNGNNGGSQHGPSDYTWIIVVIAVLVAVIAVLLVIILKKKK